MKKLFSFMGRRKLRESIAQYVEIEYAPSERQAARERMFAEAGV